VPPGPALGPPRVGLRVAPLAALLLALAACGGGRSLSDYTWIDQYPQPVRAEAPYVIAAGDLLTVRVQGQEGMSGRSRVRDDGNISLPFLNDVVAVDLTPLQLADQIQARLKEFVVRPVVVVSVEESRPFEASVVGNVRKAGTFPVDARSGVLQALAAAGGLGEFADPDRIFVLRRGDRIRFTYKALIQAERRAAAFRLRAGDVVVVE